MSAKSALPPITRQPTTRVLASPIQSFYWHSNREAPEIEALHQELVWRVTGELDVGALRDAFARLSARQDAFRARYEVVDSKLWHVVDPRLGIGFAEIDAGGDRAAVERILRDVRLRLADLERGPVASATLVRSQEREWYLYFAAHHIVFDGISYALFERELWELYAAGVERRAPALPELSLQFVDVLRWRNEILGTDAGREVAGFWRDLLAGATPVALATDRPREPVEARRKASPYGLFRAGNLVVQFPQAFQDAIKSLAVRARATRQVVMMAVLVEMLRRASGQRDVVFVCGYANRHRPGVDKVIGQVVQTLLLRLQATPDASAIATSAALQRKVFRFHAHADVAPLGVLDRFSPELLRINFNYLPSDTFLWSREAPKPPGLELRLEPDIDWSLTIHDVGFFLNDHGGNVMFNAELFDPPTVRKLVDELIALAIAMGQHPDTPIGHL